MNATLYWLSLALCRSFRRFLPYCCCFKLSFAVSSVNSIVYSTSNVNPMDILLRLFFFVVIIPSAIIHEVSHGLMAEKLGDPTARSAGRLSLNPKSHIDLWGTIALPIILLIATGGNFMFAYAKPVPFNPYNLKFQKWGPALVGAAGPFSNLLLGFVFTVFNSFLNLSQETKFAISTSAFADPLQISGLDGNQFLIRLFAISTIIILANISLAVFNLAPLPPLDGSKILFALLPDRMWRLREFLERNALIILIIFLVFGSRLILTPVLAVYSFFISLY